jgi:hypothetical protein
VWGRPQSKGILPAQGGVVALRQSRARWFTVAFDSRVNLGETARSSGAHRHYEPVLDDDDWKAVDKATKGLETRFAAWVAKSTA